MKIVTGNSKGSASLHKPAKHKGGARKGSHMTIRRAENGVSVETHHEKESGGSRNAMKAGMDTYEPPTQHLFNNHKALMDHIAEKFSDVLGHETDNAANDKKMGDHGKPAKSAAAAGGASKGPQTEEDTAKMS